MRHFESHSEPDYKLLVLFNLDPHADRAAAETGHFAEMLKKLAIDFPQSFPQAAKTDFQPIIDA
jgi:hypothetical protein